MRAGFGFLDGARVAGLDRNLGEHEPPTQVSLRPAQHGEGRAHLSGERHRPSERHKKLRAHRDAMTLLDHGSELGEQCPVRLASRNSGEFGAKGEMRLAARSNLGKQRREFGILRETRGAQRGGTARLVACQRPPQQRGSLSILRFGERTESTRIELPL